MSRIFYYFGFTLIIIVKLFLFFFVHLPCLYYLFNSIFNRKNVVHLISKKKLLFWFIDSTRVL